MDRPLRQGDRVIVQFETNESEYVIYQIDGTNIYIRPIDGEDLSLVYFNGTDYVIYKAEHIKFRFESTPHLIQDIDDPNVLINILAQLKYPDLMEMCNTSQEINRLCQMDELWRSKLLIDFGFNIPTDKPLSQIYSELYQTEQSVKGANWAAQNGHLDILKWLNQFDPPIRPDQWGANRAAENGHLEVLKWLNQFDLPILPDQWGVNWAAEHGHLEVLKWLNQLDPPILPDQEGAIGAARNGQLEVLKWLNQFDPPIRPDKHGANGAAANGYLDVLEWLNQLDPPIRPTQGGVDWAAGNGYLEVLKWLNQLDPPILPDQEGVNYAAESGHLEILNWLSQLDLSNQEGVNWVAVNRHLDALKWLVNLDPPMLHDRNDRQGRLGALKWLNKLDTSYESESESVGQIHKSKQIYLPIFPDRGEINEGDMIINKNNPVMSTPCGDINVDGQITRNIYLVRKDLNQSPKFNFPYNIQDLYLEGNCGYLAYLLSEKMGPYWKMYSVILEDSNLMNVPAHYILKTPGGLALDIIGLRPVEEIIDEWNRYDESVGYYPPRKAYIKLTGDQMDNPYYYNGMVCDKEGFEKAKTIADRILKILEEKYMIIKIVTPKDHPFKSLPSYSDVFTDQQLLTRVSDNYQILSGLGFGPEIFDQIICEQAVILYMQFLPIATTNKLIAEHNNQIQNLVNDLHSLGIYHGDLHGSNLAFTSDMVPKIIDSDTVFYRNEIENPIVNDWADNGFDMSIDEMIDWETQENWKQIVED